MKLIDPKVSLRCYTCDVDVRARKSRIVEAMIEHTFTPDHKARVGMQSKSSLERSDDE